MKNSKTILAVLAHPDEESFGVGGTLALYAGQGHNVYLVCATRGEAGDADEKYMRGYESIAQLREAELHCAAQNLGLKDVFFLGYRDSGMPGSEDNQHPDAQINAPIEEVAKKVVHYIRALRPDVVLTLDPIGGYRHPDHIRIHEATVLAFERADDEGFHPETGSPYKPGKLYFHIFPRWFLRIMVMIMPILGQNPRKWGRNRDIDLKAIAEVSFPTHARIDISPVMEIKAAASACHASQGGGQMRHGLVGWITRLFGEHEAYMQAYPPVNGRIRIKTDLLS